MFFLHFICDCSSGLWPQGYVSNPVLTINFLSKVFFLFGTSWQSRCGWSTPDRVIYRKPWCQQLRVKVSQPLDPCWWRLPLTHAQNHILLSWTHKGECVHQGGFQCLTSKRDQKRCSLPRFSFLPPAPSSLVSNQVSLFSNCETTITCRVHIAL